MVNDSTLFTTKKDKKLKQRDSCAYMCIKVGEGVMKLKKPAPKLVKKYKYLEQSQAHNRGLG